MIKVKAFEIPKELVWKSYQDVRRNRGAPGIDRQTITEFDLHRDRNLYKIWNRLSSGSYFPPPVLAKEIEKADGGTRVLGIPTVADRIAQGAIKVYLEKIVEPIFHENSFGYRPSRSAHQALEKTAERCWGKFWLLEIDIKKFFDNVNHDLVHKALDHLNVPRWVSLYCDRWMKADMQNREGVRTKRTKGVPQGGVISLLLANLFLHFAIDQWMNEHWPTVEFARYADDIVFHCKTMQETSALKGALAARLQKVGLELNEEKSNIVYLGTFERTNVKFSFTFLGYDFQYRTLRDSRSGQLFRKIYPGASKKAMRKITKTIKGWRLHRSTAGTLQDFAGRYNATLRGWISYFGKFYYRNFSYRLWSAFQSRLLKWVKEKFRVGNKEAEVYLGKVRLENPKMFVHWYLLQSSNA